MKEHELLRDMHGLIQRLDERSETHTKQLGTIFSMLNNGGCGTGKQNAICIRWVWTVGGLVTTAVFGVIFYFHL